MHYLFRITASCIALSAPLAAIAGPSEMTFDEARHLVARTGFGAAPDEIAPYVGMSYQAAVDAILDGIQTTPTTPMPVWVDAWAYPQDQIWALGQTETDLYYTLRYAEFEELQGWWLREMVETPSPLTEKLVLFWHDHFATGAESHERPQWVARQNRMFRTHAAGNFADLATGILGDPGMLVYLTNTENDASAPNENLAREFMELFTLGEGRGYDESDVTEMARALTGQTVNTEAAGQVIFDPEAHDHGPKTILGQSGRFAADDLPGIVMQDPAFGPYIVEKLWRVFISDQPDREEVARLTDLWRAADWEITPLLRAMFLSDHFWAADNRGTLVKNPVDLMVGGIRTFGIPIERMGDLNWAVSDLGQELFLPPNVGGWPEGIGWINDATATARATMLTHMLGYDPGDADHVRDGMMMQASAATPAHLAGSPDDLAIGQVFVTGANVWGEGSGDLTLTLFDVQHGGQHWRSLTFHLEVHDLSAFEIALQISDCASFCFTGWPHEADAYGWIWFEGEDLAQGAPRWLSAQDNALLASVIGHLPEMIRQTDTQRIWSPQARRAGYLKIEDAIKGANWLNDQLGDTFGAAKGKLILAQVPPATVGLAGLDAGRMGEDAIDGYLSDRSDTQDGATPRFTYADPAAWLAAIPANGFDSAKAEQTLLALPLPTEGQRAERFATDPAALIRTIVLSPYYQLN